MADSRIRGESVEIQVIDGGQLTSINDIRSFEFAAQLEILREGYLGETSDRRDEIYRGYRGRMELHFENQDFLEFMRSVIDRARRRRLGVQINIKATLNFPNGESPIVNLIDCYFGEIPVTFGSRTDYELFLSISRERILRSSRRNT